MSEKDITATSRESKAGVPAKTSNQPPAKPDYQDTAWIALVIEDCAQINEKMDVVVKLARLNGGEIEEYRDIVPMLPQIWTEVAKFDKPASKPQIHAVACWLVEVKPQANAINRAAFITAFCVFMRTVHKPTLAELMSVASAVFRFDEFLSMREIEKHVTAAKKTSWRWRNARDNGNLKERLRRLEFRASATDEEIFQAQAEDEWAYLNNYWGDRLYTCKKTQRELFFQIDDLGEHIPAARKLAAKIKLPKKEPDPAPKPANDEPSLDFIDTYAKEGVDDEELAAKVRRAIGEEEKEAKPKVRMAKRRWESRPSPKRFSRGATLRDLDLDKVNSLEEGER